MAGAIATSAPAITGTVNRADVNSFGTGSWDLAVTVRSPSYLTGYQASVSYSFATSWSAAMACQSPATAFNPAVQALLPEAFTHPELGRLAGIR